MAGIGAYDNKVDAWCAGCALYVMLVARFPVYDRDQDGTIVGARACPMIYALSTLGGLLLRLLAADPVLRCRRPMLYKDPWLLPSSELALTPPASPPEKKRERFIGRGIYTDNPMGLAHAHAALVASSALGLPPELQKQGLDYPNGPSRRGHWRRNCGHGVVRAGDDVTTSKLQLDARNRGRRDSARGRQAVDVLISKSALSPRKGNLAAMRRLAQAVGEEAHADEEGLDRRRPRLGWPARRRP